MKNKQIKNSKKLAALYTVLGLGLTSIVAGATAGVVFALKNSKNTQIDLTGKVMFNAGRGHKFETGASYVTVNLEKPTKLVDIKQEALDNVNNSFVGWAYTNDFSGGKVDSGKILASFNLIQPGSSLTAVYNTDVRDQTTFYKVEFVKNGEKASLSGTTILSVIPGSSLKDVNTPSCNPTEQRQVFKGWYKVGSATKEEYDEKTPITADLKLAPIIGEELKVTFDLNCETGKAKIESGTDHVYPKNGTLFKNINTPVLKWLDTTNVRVFAGWQTKDTEGTFHDLDPNNTITTSTTLYAKWITEDQAHADYCLVKAIEVTDVTYEGNTEFYVKKDTAWKDFNRPIANQKDKQFDGWQYRPVTDPETAWIDIPDDSETQISVDKIQIKPKMKSCITAVSIKVLQDLAYGQDVTITANVYPRSSTQEVTWSIFLDEECTVPVDPSSAYTENEQTTATESTATLKTSYLLPSSSLYIRATSTVDTTVFKTQKFTFELPFENSYDIWTCTLGASQKFYKLENVCTETGAKIKRYEYDPSISGKFKDPEEFDRTTFGHTTSIEGSMPLFFGSKLTKVPANFLYGCTNFNSPIFLNSGEDFNIPCNITEIGDNFMAGCSNFPGYDEDSGYSFNFKNIKTIGDNFMYGCSEFDQPLNLVDIEFIHDNFLAECRSDIGGFNEIITFGRNLKHIGNDFMHDCTNFDQNISLPASIGIYTQQTGVCQIGDGFMSECSDFSSTLSLDFDDARSVFPSGARNLSSSAASPKIREYGFTVDGKGSSSFPYEDDDGTVTGKKRTVIKAKTDAINNIEITESPKTNYYVGDRFTTKDMTIKVTFSDGTDDVLVNSGFTCTMDGADIGEGTPLLTPMSNKEITVDYHGATATFNIDVVQQVSITFVAGANGKIGDSEVVITKLIPANTTWAEAVDQSLIPTPTPDTGYTATSWLGSDGQPITGTTIITDGFIARVNFTK